MQQKWVAAEIAPNIQVSLCDSSINGNLSNSIPRYRIIPYARYNVLHCASSIQCRYLGIIVVAHKRAPISNKLQIFNLIHLHRMDILV